MKFFVKNLFYEQKQIFIFFPFSTFLDKNYNKNFSTIVNESIKKWKNIKKIENSCKKWKIIKNWGVEWILNREKWKDNKKNIQIKKRKI